MTQETSPKQSFYASIEEAVQTAREQSETETNGYPVLRAYVEIERLVSAYKVAVGDEKVGEDRLLNNPSYEVFNTLYDNYVLPYLNADKTISAGTEVDDEVREALEQVLADLAAVANNSIIKEAHAQAVAKGDNPCSRCTIIGARCTGNEQYQAIGN